MPPSRKRARRPIPPPTGCGSEHETESSDGRAPAEVAPKAKARAKQRTAKAKAKPKAKPAARTRPKQKVTAKARPLPESESSSGTSTPEPATTRTRRATRARAAPSSSETTTSSTSSSETTTSGYSAIFGNNGGTMEAEPQGQPLMMLRIWTARRSQTASTLLCCFSRERCHPLRGRPRHLLPLRVRGHSAVRLGAHVGRRRCFAEQASDVRAILFLGRTAPTDIPSREIKYGGCAAMHMLADASVLSHVSVPVSLDVLSRVQPSFDSVGRDPGGPGNFCLQASVLPRHIPHYSWSAFVPFHACRPDRGSLGQPAQRSGHQLRAVLLSGLFVPLLPCDIDPGRGIRAAGPPSQNVVQCGLSYPVLYTTPADVAARVPLKRLGYRVYSIRFEETTSVFCFPG